MSASHILVVDDEPDIRHLVQEILEDEGYRVDTAEDGAHARKALEAGCPDLMLLDIWMPDVDGISLLKELKDSGELPCPVIVMSGHGTVETAVEATRLGAYDFLEKPLSMAKLLLTVGRALEANRLYKENQGLKQAARGVHEPLGHSAIMSSLREQAMRIARHDHAWVLITGEPGTGKLPFAHFLHNNSPRADGPLVQVRVGSILRQNAAQELFGSETGNEHHVGYLEQANGGTLVLDDIADMDERIQSQLVSALERGSFLRVGGTDSVSTDVRVIAATHRDLEELVREGRFREDLYYRLNVVPLHVPPLRDHREDVPDLLNHYLGLAVEREGLPYRRFNTAAQNRLRNYEWPGNIRELSNLVQRLMILSSGEEIDVNDVELALGAGNRAPEPETTSPVAGLFDLPLRDAREQFERAYMQHHLEQLEGSVSQLARVTGMERTNLYRKLKSLGIEIK
ncbi:MAG: sigma-54-dependent transcriptional regulator [Gammaproteobacteria bacterium]